MKRLLTLSLVSAAALMSLAGTPRSRVYTTDAWNNKTYYELDGTQLRRVESLDGELRQTVRRTPRHAPVINGTEEPKRLDIQIVYDETEVKCEAFNAGFLDAFDGVRFYDPPKNLGFIDIPSGVKGLVVIFCKYDEQTHKSTYYVNFQDISKLGSGSKVVFDIADCIHKFNYRPLGEDGNYIDLQKRNNDDITTPGDFEYAFGLINLNHVDDGQLWMASGAYKWYPEEDGTYWLQDFGDWYVNDCGPDFYISQHVIAMPAKGHDYTLIEMPVYRCRSDKTPSEVVLSNDPRCFQNYVREWTRSPYSVSSNKTLRFGAKLGIEQGELCYMTIGGEIDIENINDEVGDVTNIETRLKVCANNPESSGAELTSMICIDNMPESADDGDAAIASMYWKPGENGRQYLAINHQGYDFIDVPYEVYMNFVDDNYDEYLRTKGAPNPHLAFDDAKIKGRFGNNTPIISMLPSDYWDVDFGSDLVRWYMGLVGRYGEGNAFGAQQLLEYSEENKYDSEGYRKQTASYDNILIDGEVDGNVTAELFVKQGKGAGVDFIPPVLTWLGFKDKDENLTDRFQTGADGTLEFYATDFYLTKDWSLGKYDFFTYKCKTIPNVKVEYAPYGTTGFKELPVKEIEEKFFYPGWGSFYSAPLEKVDRYSENGWYDLRISLEDATGNRHVQTLSPAFKLLDFSGVETVTDTDTDGAKAYYNLQGVRVANPGNGIFIEVGSDGSRKVAM